MKVVHTVADGARDLSVKSGGHAMSGSNLSGASFYVWDESRRDALAWGSELYRALITQRRHVDEEAGPEVIRKAAR